jgi:hypothetical protein
MLYILRKTQLKIKSDVLSNPLRHFKHIRSTEERLLREEM